MLLGHEISSTTLLLCMPLSNKTEEVVSIIDDELMQCWKIPRETHCWGIGYVAQADLIVAGADENEGNRLVQRNVLLHHPAEGHSSKHIGPLLAIRNLQCQTRVLLKCEETRGRTQQWPVLATVYCIPDCRGPQRKQVKVCNITSRRMQQPYIFLSMNSMRFNRYTTMDQQPQHRYVQACVETPSQKNTQSTKNPTSKG